MTDIAPALCLAGPTAVGKSAVALCLAEHLGGEIVSVDSMQVYRGLDLGTAKPSAADRQRVPHHLIDVADLTEAFDAAQFVSLANAAVAQIIARGHVPILCGGTGLYLRAYLEGLGEAPPGDAVLREQLAVTPLPELLEELAARDPDAYQWIDRANRRRVERAVEVIRLTGRPFSTQRAHWTEKPAHEAELRTKTAPTGPPASVADPEPPPGASGLRLVVLTREAGDLKARIDARVEAMFARGLVAETEALLARGLERNRTALQALGYRQVVEHLRGVRCLADTVALVKRKTRQYAKRQLAWFRHQLRAEWVVLAPTSEPAQVAEHLLAHHFKACAR